MKAFFEELYHYNWLVNGKINEAVLSGYTRLPVRTIAVTAHIQLVHLSWNNRMHGIDTIVDLWKEVNKDDLSKLNDNNLKVTLEILNTVGLEDTFSYKNSQGKEFTNTYKDVLFHLINHGSYHRGQINASLREAGFEPVITEYIFYKR